MNNLTAEAWEQRYQENNAPWDLNCPAPPFVELLASKSAPQPGKIAVLGCGKGHDALLFAESGFEVTGFDFASTAIASATEQAKEKGLKAKFLERNIFELEAEFASSFDYVLEHTCFCAIEPTKRSQYVEVVKNLLHPGGKLIALFFTHKRSGGPPFGVQPQEIQNLFAPYFDFEFLQITPHSIPRRQQEEHLAIFRKKEY